MQIVDCFSTIEKLSNLCKIDWSKSNVHLAGFTLERSTVTMLVLLKEILPLLAHFPPLHQPFPCRCLPPVLQAAPANPFASIVPSFLGLACSLYLHPSHSLCRDDVVLYPWDRGFGSFSPHGEGGLSFHEPLHESPPPNRSSSQA